MLKESASGYVHTLVKHGLFVSVFFFLGRWRGCLVLTINVCPKRFLHVLNKVRLSFQAVSLNLDTQLVIIHACPLQHTH